VEEEKKKEVLEGRKKGGREKLVDTEGWRESEVFD
jgi:hypothetical protein